MSEGLGRTPRQKGREPVNEPCAALWPGDVGPCDRGTDGCDACDSCLCHSCYRHEDEPHWGDCEEDR